MESANSRNGLVWGYCSCAAIRSRKWTPNHQIKASSLGSNPNLLDGVFFPLASRPHQAQAASCHPAPVIWRRPLPRACSSILRPTRIFVGARGRPLSPCRKNTFLAILPDGHTVRPGPAILMLIKFRCFASDRICRAIGIKRLVGNCPC